MSGALLQIGDVVAAGRRVEDSADVVVVGSGAAGATVARVLTELGVDVIVVEEGPRVPDEALRADVYSGFRSVWRDAGMQVAEGKAFMPVLQARCVGGTTAINGAIIHRMPEAIHAAWVREHGLGDALPWEALHRVWDTLDRELHVGPAPEAVRGDNNRLMERGLTALGLTSNPIRRNVHDCQGTARCLQGCPTGRRQSMNVSYVPRAIRQGARVYATARMERLETAGGRAAGVRGRFVDPESGRPGPEFVFRARRAVVLAASAIQTPLLLARAGVGRRSGLVGRRFQAHPGAAVLGVFDQPVRMWEGATQGHESTHFWHERMKFESLALPPEIGAVRLPGHGRALMRQLADYQHVAQWGVQIRAHAHGRVLRGLTGRTVIKYGLTPEDVRLMKTGLTRLTEMMFAAGAREVLPGLPGLPDRITSPDPMRRLTELPDDPRLFHAIAAHLFGTAVMGPDPRTSVVAPTGEAHELPGLFVADSSIFPTNLGVNPQHTISAVAWLMAERIADAGAAGGLAAA